jgi:hypothetical protein
VPSPPRPTPAVKRIQCGPSGHNGKVDGKRIDEPQPGDLAGPYLIEELHAMNDRFVQRVESAFASGKESRRSARATYRDVIR